MPLVPAAWRDLALVMATATLVGMTFSLAVPLLSLVLEREGVDPFAIGLNTAAGGLGIFVVAPFVDRLVRRLGPVRCIRSALVVTAGCMLVFPLWVEPVFWAPVRLVFGCAGALLFVLSEASVNTLAPKGLRGRVLGLYATLFSLGFAAGPLLLMLAGSEGVLPFALASALFLLGLVPAACLRAVEGRMLPEGHGRLRLLDTWRIAPVAMAGVFVYALLESAHFALLPVYALDLGTGERTAAALVAVWLSGNILFQYPVGWLADRWQRQRVMLVCASLAVAGLLLVPRAAGHVFLLWPLLVLLGGAMGALYTLPLVLVGERFRGADLTKANTAFVMTFQLGAIAGPPFTGAVMDTAGSASFPLALVPPLLVLLAVLLVAGHARAPASQADP
ncbi:MFS transporter [Benzoatithermus flavus]|uniref:MFS transporter n=1 Tax=Benzoatithermus flavus TaxID=3108223 RepID=A0ABU8XNC3_9PROT